MKINIKEAISLINSGKVIAVPTETVYGLAAAFDNDEAVKNIFSLKGRPLNNPLIIHVSDFTHILPFLKRPVDDLEILSKRFWPGSLTIILPIKKELISSYVRADLQTAAFRIPSHPLALALIEETGPLVMPSANLSGKPSATTIEDVEEDFGLKFPVLDGGKCTKGLESTIIMYRDAEWQIVREGSISKEQFESTLGYIPKIYTEKANDKPICPGQMYRHYSPKAKLFLKTDFNNIYEGVILGFSDRSYPAGCQIISMGYLSNPADIAKNLYSTLRNLDRKNIMSAYVDMNFSDVGLFSTIKERLSKASIK